MVNLSNISMPSLNWSTWTSDIFNWSMQGYTNAAGFFVWPIIFSFIIGYVVIKQKSVVAGAVGILVLFACFGTSSLMVGVSEWVMFAQLMFALVVTGLVVMFLMRRR